MDLEHYKNFVAIVEAGNLTQAAQRVHVAQPALSAQLKALEKELGACLVLTRRGSRKLLLTDAGHVLYTRAKHLCAIAASLRDEVAACACGVQGKLRLSLSPSRVEGLVGKFLVPFSRLYPEVRYELYEGSITEQAGQLLDGVTELGFSNAPLCQPERFEVLQRREEVLAVVFRRDSGWIAPEAAELTLAALQAVPLHMPGSWVEDFRRACREAGLAPPQILSVCTGKATALQWARAGAGAAIVSVEEMEAFGPELCCRAIADARFCWQKTVIKVKGRDLSSVAQKFIEYYASVRCVPEPQADAPHKLW